MKDLKSMDSIERSIYGIWDEFGHTDNVEKDEAWVKYQRIKAAITLALRDLESVNAWAEANKQDMMVGFRNKHSLLSSIRGTIGELKALAEQDRPAEIV